jgi:hypothetical protein
MKVNRVLDRSEVNAINEAAGVKDLPTLSELNKGYSKGGTVMDDYQYAEMMGNGYAVGGVVEKQTRMAFADGGLPVDPVSGNEVPPGSLPEEVRDDIKVGVSEGEYIVPADVLRYYGMKFFEDLRAEAKVALSGMEQDGRMGGEPMMEAPMEEEDDLPFSTEELQATDDMNEGGYMRGYADGGYTTPDAAAALYPESQMTNIFGEYGGSNTGGITYVTYYGPNGETEVIQTFNGNPMTPPTAGYTSTPPVATAPPSTAAGQVAAAPAPSNDNDRPDRLEPPERIAIGDMTTDQLSSRIGNIGGFSQKAGVGIASILGTMFGGPLGTAVAGKLVKNSIIKENQSAMTEAKKRVEAAIKAGDTATAKALQDSIDAAIERNPNKKDKKGWLSSLFGNNKEETSTTTTSTAEVVPDPIAPPKSSKSNVVIGSDPDATKRSRSDNINMAQANADKNIQSVVDKAISKGATEKQVKTIKSEGASVKEKLKDMNTGKNTTGKVGFAKGGLMTKKK